MIRVTITEVYDFDDEAWRNIILGASSIYDVGDAHTRDILVEEEDDA